MSKWSRLKPHQFYWLKKAVALFCICVLVLYALFASTKRTGYLLGVVAVLSIGVLFTATVLYKTGNIRKISRLMEQFIRNNGLYQAHTETTATDRKREVIDYYPALLYCVEPKENIFCIKVRLDGNLIAERIKSTEIETALADMFAKNITEKIEEYGSVTYHFELRKQEQIIIHSRADIPIREDSSIVLSPDIVWDYKKSPHLLLTGQTGSGKTQLVQYIIICLLAQGVRVIYCDPKNDDDMRYYMRVNPAVLYVTKENDIARAVRELSEEISLREKDLKNCGTEEAEFNPVFLLFDERIAFAKIANKRTYEETANRLGAIVVSGRSKRVYCGIITQRADVKFVEGSMRENLCCRICMGQMSEAAYKMAFGEDFAHVKNYRREIGAGLIYRNGIDSKPREFIAPFIEKGALSREK